MIAPVTTSRISIAVLGTGYMGAALARAMLRAGHPVTVWNRTSARAAVLRDDGATVAPTPADAVRAAELVLLCVLTQPAAEELLADSDLATALRGRTLVQYTTGAPGDARRTAAWARAHDVDYLDAVILAYPRNIGHPEALIVYAGRLELFDTHRDSLEALGVAQHVGEDAGLSAVYDASVLWFYYCAYSGFLHGAAIAEAEGLPIETFLDAAKRSVPVLVDSLQDTARRIRTGDYAGDDAKIATHRSGYDSMIISTAKEAGVPLDPVLPLRDLMDAAIDRNRDEQDIAALFDFIERNQSSQGTAPR
jgi:3-hydroxyisobutyrate dehydrogenase-like beta-hydroxyacid dehydrogenase